MGANEFHGKHCYKSNLKGNYFEIHKFFISSACKLVLGKEEKIQVSKSKHEKCSRCWHRVEGVEAGGHCSRCEDNMNGEGEIRSFF